MSIVARLLETVNGSRADNSHGWLKAEHKATYRTDTVRPNFPIEQFGYLPELL